MEKAGIETVKYLTDDDETMKDRTKEDQNNDII